MLITKEVEVTATPNQANYYESKGYIIERYINRNKIATIKKGTKLLVKIEDLPQGSNVNIVVECDYCRNQKVISYKRYVNSILGSPVQKYACGNCISQKNIESNILKYGVPCTMQVADVRNQFKIKYEDAKLAFEQRNYILISENYEDCTKKLKYICAEHANRGIQQISWTQFNRGQGCRYCGYDTIRSKTKRDNNINWKGGVSSIATHLRQTIMSWKKDSLKFYNYTCQLTNNRGYKLQIHHLYSFNKILCEVMDELNLDLKLKFIEYSAQELERLEKRILEKHYERGYGIVLIPELHKLFHNTNGKGNNTPEQFEDFKTRLKSGEFDEFLKENNLTLVI